ncbi:DUF1634 domain-containing protein [Melioribacteraceae bacterium 4301-Me]|uniref:DUF1634 domain-containing protein n=1 Tax=Pyranulibacter aquaticus TaxID=3163344 RepID=UPI0035993765
MKEKFLINEERKLETFLADLLRVGVIISAVLVVVGGIIYLYNYGHQPPRFSVFNNEPSDLKNFFSILKGMLELKSLSIIQLGILALIATPVLRVFFSFVGFIHEKDVMYSFFTLIVLSVLLFSLFG